MSESITVIPTVTIPMHDVAVTAVSYTADSIDTLAMMKRMEITTPEEYENLIELLGELKGFVSGIEELRQSFVKPLNDVVKRINLFFKPTLERYAEAEAEGKRKLQQFAAWADAERERLLQEAEQEAQGGDTVAAAQAIFDAAGSIVPKVAGYSERSTWVGEVVDASRLPREYLMPDLAKLQAATKAGGAATRIPGWRVFKKQISTMRFGKR